MRTKKPLFLSKILFSNLIIGGISLFFLVACNQASKTEQGKQEIANKEEAPASDSLSKATFSPFKAANAQFAGYYMAVEKGMYKRYGIDLKIIPHQPFVATEGLMEDGKTDFSVLRLVNAIELKDYGIDLVNIAQLSDRSSLMLITKKSSGIDALEKMNGKKVGIWRGFDMQPNALFNKYNLDVNIIPIGSTNTLFLMDGVDIIIANWYDEYHSMIYNGLDSTDLNTFVFADYGFNFVEDGIYCSAEKLKNDPELCANFVQATLEGWIYAFDHREETIDAVVKYAKDSKLSVNRIHQKWMLDRYEDMYVSKIKGFNINLSRNDYESVGNILKESGKIKQVPSFDDFFQPVVPHNNIKTE
jgi:NitT/TauT family transport system substrate-binding protein